MSELLYLKDVHVKEFIERLFVAYRESFSDPKKTLNNLSLGTAHHKVTVSYTHLTLPTTPYV